MKESAQSIIEIKDNTYVSFLHFLEFIYTGSLQNMQLTVDGLIELLGLSDKYVRGFFVSFS